MDIGIRIMDEYTRIYISGCIDVQVVTSARDTSADVLRIILEVQTEDWFGASESTDTFVYSFSLLWIWHKFRSGVISNWHIVEEPDE